MDGRGGQPAPAAVAAGRGPSLRWQLAGVAALALLALAVPVLRTPLLVATNWGAVALVLAGVHRYRPAARTPWWATAALAALVAAGNTAVAVTGGQTPLAVALTTAGQAAAVLVVPPLFRHARSAAAPSRYRTADLAIWAVGIGLVTAEVFTLAERSPARHSTALVLAPCADVVIVGLLARLLLSRGGLVPSVRIGAGAAFAIIAFDLVVTLSGQRVALPGQAVQALGVLNMPLLGLAAVHPSMTRFGTSLGSTGLRRGSRQVLATLPPAAAPPVLWALGALGAVPPLPVGAVVATGSAVAGLALVRALGTLRDSERQAERDPLTDLLNRRGLSRALAGVAAAGGGGLLALVDLDDFKQVNDRHGHDVGDAVLVAAAGRLTGAVGGGGTVFRTGGDEFVLLLPAAPGEPGGPGGPGSQGHGVEALVHRALGAPVVVGGRTFAVRASVGVVEVPACAPLQQLLADVDVAMYAAKRRGRGLVVAYRPGLREEVLGRSALAEELRRLLTAGPLAEAGHLEVHLQPVVELDGARLHGAEALVRWRHPARGLLAPDDFLPLAEEAGLGRDLDLLVLRTALGQVPAWDAAGGGDLRLSVNLGLGSTCSPSLVGDVLAALEDSGVAASRLTLEITEHDEVPDHDDIAGAFAALAAAGVGLGLDDFGVGYSALSYLQRYPISVVKLDRTMLPRDPRAPAAMLEGVAALAAALAVPLLAEGVEHAEQVPLLRRLGIRYAQGYHFGRPAPAAQFLERVRAAAPPAAAAPAPAPAPR